MSEPPDDPQRSETSLSRPIRVPVDERSAKATLDSNTSGRDTIEFPKQQLGNYEIIDEIARGGMGIVYRARQINADRVVALKLIRGSDPDPKELQRFQAEAKAAARLDHPNIVPIYDVGIMAGEPFFTMKFVEGQSLSQRLDGKPIEAELAARIVRDTTSAMGHAHEHGIIHRDLKPANILLDTNDHPMVTDFGLAKLSEDSDLTRTGQAIGTPAYMPPEQASGDRTNINERSDVYSLGAVLYACLTGRPPFQGASAMATTIAVMRDEPVAPSWLNAEVPRDLETICLKCLEKSPSVRYESTHSLQDELQRFLLGQPILARPTSRVERAMKWAKRNRLVAGLSSLAAMALIVIFVGGVIYQWRLTAALRSADKAQETAETSQAQQAATLYDALVKQAGFLNDLRPVGYGEDVRTAVSQALQIDTPQANRDELRQLLVSSLGQSTSTQWRDLLRQPDSTPLAFDLDPLGQSVFVGEENGSVSVFDRRTAKLVERFEPHTRSVIGIRFPTETSCYTYTLFCREVMRWQYDGSHWKPIERVDPRTPDNVTDIRMTRDGRFYIGWTDCELSTKTTQYANSEQPKPVTGFPGDTSFFCLRSVQSDSSSMRAIPVPAKCVFDFRDGVLAALTADDVKSEVILFDLHDDRRPRRYPVDRQNSVVSLSPDGKSFVASGHTGAYQHATKDGRLLKKLLQKQVLASSFIGNSDELSCWCTDTQEVIPLANPGGGYSLPRDNNEHEIWFSSCGRVRLSAHLDTLKTAIAETRAPECRVIRNDARSIDDLSLSADGTVLCCSRNYEHVQLIETKTGNVLAEVPGIRGAIHPDEKYLAVSDFNHLRILVLPYLNEVARATISPKLFNRLRFNHNGTRLLGFGWDGDNTAVYEMKVSEDNVELSFLSDLDSQCNSADWSSEDDRLAWIRLNCEQAGQTLLLGADGGNFSAAPITISGIVPSAKYESLTFLNPERLALLDSQNRLALLDCSSHRVLRRSDREFSRPLKGSPDGRFLFSKQQLVDGESLLPLFELPSFASDPWAIDWSRDGRRVAFGYNGGEIAVWDVARINAALSEIGFDRLPCDEPHAPPSPPLVKLQQWYVKSKQNAIDKAIPQVDLQTASEWKDRPTRKQWRDGLVRLRYEGGVDLDLLVDQLFDKSQRFPVGDEEYAINTLIKYVVGLTDAPEPVASKDQLVFLTKQCLRRFEQLDSPTVVTCSVMAGLLSGTAKRWAENRPETAKEFARQGYQLFRDVTQRDKVNVRVFDDRAFWIVNNYLQSVLPTGNRDEIAKPFGVLFDWYVQHEQAQPGPAIIRQWREIATSLGELGWNEKRRELLQRCPELLSPAATLSFKLWSEEWNGGSAGSMLMDGDEVSVKVDTVPPKDWQAKLVQRNLPFQEGEVYSVSFQARSEKQAHYSIAASIGVSDWHNVGLLERFVASDVFQTYQFVFVARDTAANCRVSFHVGEQSGTLSVRDFEIKLISGELAQQLRDNAKAFKKWIVKVDGLQVDSETDLPAFAKNVFDLTQQAPEYGFESVRSAIVGQLKLIISHWQNRIDPQRYEVRMRAMQDQFTSKNELSRLSRIVKWMVSHQLVAWEINQEKHRKQGRAGFERIDAQTRRMFAEDQLFESDLDREWFWFLTKRAELLSQENQFDAAVKCVDEAFESLQINHLSMDGGSVERIQSWQAEWRVKAESQKPTQERESGNE